MIKMGETVFLVIFAVYKATTPEGRRVAVKHLNEVAAFTQEVEMMRIVRSRHLVRLVFLCSNADH